MKKFLQVLYWIISLTWGALMTIPGLIGALLVIIAGGKAEKNGFSFIVKIGGNWGGISLGAVAFCGNYEGEYFEYIRRHEFGHSIQNLIFGPLFLFVIGIPSLIRSWLFKADKIKHPYDYIWFEYTASTWGTKAINYIEDQIYVYKYKRK